MINFQLFTLCHVLRMLRDEEARFAMLALGAGSPKPTLAQAYVGLSMPVITDKHKQEIKPLLEITKAVCDQLQIQAGIDRFTIFTGKMRFSISANDFVAEIRFFVRLSKLLSISGTSIITHSKKPRCYLNSNRLGMPSLKRSRH